MAGFRKAKGEQAFIKMGMYGPPGSGKTFTALLLAEGLAKLSGKRVALVDTEHGSDFYCQTVKSRVVHPEAFDFDALYTKAITDATEAITELNPDEYGVLVLDSVTHFWEAAMAAYSGKRTKADTIPMYAWGKIKKPYKNLMAYMLSMPMHVIICGRQKTEYTTDEESEELKAIGVTMRAEGETPYEPHILIRMEAIRPKRTNERSEYVAYAEKDRTGVLSGRSFINPTFKTLCAPILPLLGQTQAQIPTSDETASQDAEKLADEQHARDRESTSLLENFAARLTLCKDLKALKDIGAEITPKVKAKMGPDDVATLRDKYLEREKELKHSEGEPAESGDGNPGNPVKMSEKAQALIQEIDAMTTLAEIKEFRKTKRLEKDLLDIKEQLEVARHWQSRKEVLEDKDKNDKSQGKLQV